jgi:hypothetical protein
MPIFMDRHDIPEARREDVIAAQRWKSFEDLVRRNRRPV